MAKKSFLLLVVPAPVVIAAGVACGDDEGDGTPASTATVEEAAPTATAGAEGAAVEVLLDGWSVVANPSEVAAGDVTFTAVNAGDEDHELVVVKTDTAPDALPVVDGKVDEATAGEVIGEIEEFASGGEEAATFTLTPGNYVLFCNITETEASGEIESHYEEGMHTAFVVTE